MKPRTDRTKLYRILAIAGGLMVIMLIVNWLGGEDTSRQQFIAIYTNNQELITASEIAKNKAANFEVRSLAASLASTTSSEQNELTAYFGETYGAKLAAGENVEPATFQELEDMTPSSAFDEAYLEAITPRLQENLNQVASLKTDRDSRRNQLLGLIEHNQSSYLETAEKLRPPQ